MKSISLAAHTIGALLMTASLTQALEAKMYAISKWDGGCSGSQRDSWDNMASAWYNEITNSGTSVFGWCVSGHCSDAFTKEGSRINGSITNSLLADASRVSFGNDATRLDAADAAIIALHGADVSNGWSGSLRVNESGSGDCKIQTNEMEIGDTDLEFLHLSSCYSMNDTQWSTWEKSMARAHQIDGFHGLMWIGSGLVDDYEDMADDGFGGPISDAWIDNMYYNNEFGDNNTDDQCPVAFAVGSSSNDATNRLHHERYNNVYSDPPNSGLTGSGTIWATTYISGCNPAGENTVGQ